MAWGGGAAGGAGDAEGGGVLRGHGDGAGRHRPAALVLCRGRALLRAPDADVQGFQDALRFIC